MKRKLVHIISRARFGLLGGALAIALCSLALTSKHVMAGDNTSARVTPVTITVNDTDFHSDMPQRGTANGPILSFAPIVKRVAPSVVEVSITTKSREIQMPDGQGAGPDDLFRRFFGEQFGMGPQQHGGTMHTPKEHGLGSGVIITKDGYIITNNHVVENADTIRVKLNDGREFSAKVIGRDPKSDVAVVKIDAKDLPFLTIADSDKLEVGDVCLAIGNPFGIGQTVTMGIVSAVGRGNLGLGDEYEDFIQTDAAINPGNSGGALVDAESRLIGINTAILSRSGGNQGIGFAVPVNLARNVMESLIAHGKVVRGFLGVHIQDIDPELAAKFKLDNNHGALVTDVSPHAPAQQAGIESGDVIVEFNHAPVADSRRLKLEVAETTPGTTVPLKLIRDGREKTVKITVRELDSDKETVQASNDADKNNDTLNGVGVADIDSQTRSQLGVPSDVKGAVISSVDENSTAYEAGLRQGDVIEEINRSPVASAEDAVRLTEHVKDRVTLLKIWDKDGKGTRFLVVDESKNN